MAIKTVRIDEHKCIGAGQCVLAAPEVFDQREEDGIVVLLQPHPPASLASGVLRAAKLCPARVIVVEEG